MLSSAVLSCAAVIYYVISSVAMNSSVSEHTKDQNMVCLLTIDLLTKGVLLTVWSSKHECE